MAHMLEHVCFLGSRRRIELQSGGLGMTSNACTDFNHTVYHLSMNTEHLQFGLEALADIGFLPAFEPQRVAKERAAVLSEAQMVNDCQYRLQTQFLGGVHRDNIIHERFPIGLEAQIASWSVEQLRAFHDKWYVPENSTLYIVGDIDEELAAAKVHEIFSCFSASKVPISSPWKFDEQSLYRPAMDGRPSILHTYVKTDDDTDVAPPAFLNWRDGLEVSIEKNDLLQGMQICWAAKMPLVAASRSEDLSSWLCTRLVVEAVRLRFSGRWRSGVIPCNFHSYDSIREAVAMTTLTIMTEPTRWEMTCEDVLQEILAIAKYGLAEEELELAKRIVLDRVREAANAQPWAMMGTLHGYDPAGTSREVIDELIATTPCGHLLLDAKSFELALQKASREIDLATMNSTARAMLGFFGGEAGGRARGTVVVSCPAAINEEHTGNKIPFVAPSVAKVAETLRNVPELDEAEASSRCVSCPAAMPPAKEDYFTQPVTLEDPAADSETVTLQLANGLTVRMLVMPANPSSGPARGGMRLTVPGGRAGDVREGRPASSEMMLQILDNCGAGEWSREEVQLYRVLNSVTTHLRAGADALELDVHFAPSPSSTRAALEWLHWTLKDPKLDLTGFSDAQLRMKGNALAREKSLEARGRQELLESMYPSQTWLAEAQLQEVNHLTLGAAKKARASQFTSVSGMELNIAVCVASRSGSTDGLMHEESADINGNMVTTEESAAVAEMRRALEREIHRCLSPLLGGPHPGQQARPAPSASSRGCERRVHIPDNDARALVLVGGTCPGFWGRGDDTWETTAKYKKFSWGATANENPLYPAKAMELMIECLNTRLLGRVRDQLSLTYNCDIELTMFEGFDAGHFICKVFTFPETQQKAALAAVEVLRSPGWMPFTDREIEASKRVMAYREARSQREEKGYWLGRVSPLPVQDISLSPGNRFEGERKLLESLGSDDVQRAWHALGSLDDPFVVLATSGSPQVAGMLPPTQVVDRSRVPEAVAAAEAAAPQSPSGAASQIFLD
eukprot:TRINITY_DN23384_c0_g1_i1.p1 TRINITY_DN23384_c0_g1~~TRINITY_DN23384_c0_g1_i1.p1  ORF type:complete len:1191 (-),score=182.40 TRINITY_DN23384_c0_g1_i1:314-3379(-)